MENLQSWTNRIAKVKLKIFYKIIEITQVKSQIEFQLFIFELQVKTQIKSLITSHDTIKENTKYSAICKHIVS